ncbi:MAG: chromate transporter, partial [Actinocrinis sp.]
MGADAVGEPVGDRVGLGTIFREWGRIGCVGFGGPPAHIALLRKLCVQER